MAYAAEAGSRIVHFGFPLETVTDPATRADLACRVAAFLLDGTGGPPRGTPRIINPGFEQGPNPSAWQTKTSSSDPIFYQGPSLPASVEPYGGEWLAWLGGYTPGISTTTALTQVVGLPSGEPTATLSLAWFVQAEGTPPLDGDRLAVDRGFDWVGGRPVNSDMLLTL